VDVVSFGEQAENETRLKAFVDNVTSAENSHLVSIPAGARLLSDAVASSSILAGDIGHGGDDAGDVAGPSGAGGTGNDFEFGVDPSLDPELAMALRMSLDEENARQAAAAGSSTAPASSAPTLPTVIESVPSGDQSMGELDAPVDEEDEDFLLQQAIALSKQTGEGVDDVEMGEGEDAAHVEEDLQMAEDEDIARAIGMSNEEEEKDGKKPKS